jgi:MFS family permease
MTSTPSTGPTSLWRDRRFGTFWTGYTVSQLGDRVTELALPLIAVVMLGATASQVGLLTAAVWLPSLLSLFVGAWVDQQARKRRLMVLADLARAAVLFSLPVAYLLDAVTFVQLVVVALLTGAGSVVFDMAYPSFFVALVDRDAYLEANSKLSSSRAASFVAGPAVGGTLIQAVTAPVAVLVDAVSFVVSAVLLGRLRVEEPVPVSESSPPLTRRALDGLRFIARHPVLRACLGCSTTLNFFTFIANALLILFASRELGLSAGVIGLAVGAGAAGGLLGAVVAPAVGRWIGVGRAIVVGAVLFPAPFGLVAAAGGSTWTKAAVLGAAELLSSIGVMLFDVNQNALRAVVTPDELRGRTAGAFSAVNYGVRPLGAVVGGTLGTALGLRPTLLLAAAGGTAAFLWLLPSPIPHIADLGTRPTVRRDPRSGR